MVRVEAFDQRERALCVFLDTEGAFNTCYDSMCDVLVRHGGGGDHNCSVY